MTQSDLLVEDQVRQSGNEQEGAEGGDNEPPKKKRKRVRKKRPMAKGEVKDGDGGAEGGSGSGGGDNQDGEGKDAGTVSSKKMLKKKKRKEMEKDRKQQRVLFSEMRRRKRINQRNAETICFACREKGHAAKDCPNVKSSDGNNGAQGQKRGSGKGVVGMCYRCGSTRHTLSRCKKPVDQLNPLPFALCFVCNGEGHLASSCPQNQDKGIYPNGGCCKLCGEKTHLAKDCELRKRDVVNTIGLVGTGDRSGADEDDFHTFKRRTAEVEKEVKIEDAKKKMLQAKTGVQSGDNKSMGAASKPSKKVVYF